MDPGKGTGGPGNWSKGRFSYTDYFLVIILNTMNMYYPVNLQISIYIYCKWNVEII